VKLLYFALLLAVCLAPTQEKSVSENSVEASIRHVTVINFGNGSEPKVQTLTIRGNRIASIAVTQDSDNSLSNSIDARGAFLIPGLWDLHVHVHDVNELPLYIANGVTGIRVMSGEKDTAAYRAELARQQPSPEIYLASAIVDGSPPIWPGSIVVKKPDDARRSVDEIKTSGADFIKVYTRVPRATHTSRWPPKQNNNTSISKATSPTPSPPGSLERRSAHHGASPRHRRLLLQPAAIPDERSQPRRIFPRPPCRHCRRIPQHRSGQVPGAVRAIPWQQHLASSNALGFENLGLLNESKLTSDPRLAYIGKKSRERWQERIQPQLRIWNNSQYQFARSIFSADQHILGAMFRAGVAIMAGTDAMNPFCFPGFSLHDELAMMVDSGMTILAALQSATINPAKFLARDAKDLGAIEPGKIANLVLLRADPLADIHNATQIQAVWLQGKYFDQAALAQLLETAKP
jgi:hypothetical protein